MSKRKRREPKRAEQPRVSPSAARLDINAAALWPAHRHPAEQAIWVLSTYAPDAHDLAYSLKACGVDTVAMQGTGVCWILVHDILQERGSEMYMVNAQQLRSVLRRKSEVCDAEWIHSPQSCGLLRGLFLPNAASRSLRAHRRQRMGLIEYRSPHIRQKQKALRQTNVQLSQVPSNITGTTGVQIMRATLDGERNPFKLAQPRDRRYAHTTDEIARALTGNYQDQCIFALKQALALYKFSAAKIAECDGRHDTRRAGHGLPPLAG